MTKKIFAELKRRHVFRVAIIYATVVWVVVQLADILFEAFEIDNFVMQILIAISVATFPAVILAAWFLDWTKKGVEVTDVQDTKRIQEIQDNPSIAVMPFTDLSPDKNFEYFGHGIAEEITVRLTKFEWLQVAARTTSFGMKLLEQDVNLIGSKLGVSTVLDGTVQSSGERIRVSVELLDVARGMTLWAEHFDGELSDVFRIQDDMASNVVATLGRTLHQSAAVSGEELTDSADEPSKDAYNLYLAARYHYNKATPTERDAAAKLYGQVISAEPDFAPAYAGLAISRAVTLIGGTEMQPPTAIMPPARDAALKAIDLDPASAEGKGALAWITMTYDWEFARAGELFEDSIGQGLNANILIGYGMYQLLAGRLDLGMEAAERAVDHEPLSLVALSGAARFYRYAGEYEKGTAACNQILALDKNSKAASINLFEISMAQQDYAAAAEAIDMEVKIAEEGDLGVAFHRGRLAGMQGNLDLVERAFEQISSLRYSRYVPPFMPSVLCLFLQDYDGLFDYLDQGVTNRDAFLLDISRFKMPRTVRNDPRYADIVDRIGVEKFQRELEAKKQSNPGQTS